MATTLKVLGQANPGATTPTDLYTVPTSTSTVCSTLLVCNQGAGAGTYRLSVRPAGVTGTAKHYIAYDTAIAGNANTYLTLGLTLATTDVVTVYASTATMSFALFGQEVT